LIEKILISRVRPGKELVLARSFRLVNELMTLDFPTLDRPMKAIWGVPSSKTSSAFTIPLTNFAEILFESGNDIRADMGISFPGYFSSSAGSSTLA
jgi:hypothetical protein